MVFIIKLLIFVLMDLTHGYKVLVHSSKLGFSHMNFMGSTADTLQAAGNDVTVLQPIINNEIRGTGCNLAKVLTVEEDEATLKAIEPVKGTNLWSGVWTSNIHNPVGSITLGATLAAICNAGMKNVLQRQDIMSQLRQENFDIAIFEFFDYGALPIFYELRINTTIGVSSSYLTDRPTWAVGIPILPATSVQVERDDGSFTSRLMNLIFTLFSWQFEGYLEGHAQTYMDEHFPDAPKIMETIGNMPFIFTNSEPLIDFSRVKLHKVIDLGGITIKQGKKIDENWGNLLSKRRKNVLISYGSVAPSSSMPLDVKENIVNVVKKFPEVTFIWKYETPEDGLGNGVANLHLTKWTPQTELFASGHIDLFITHGGAGSVMESAVYGVPLLAVPLFGDQRRNALMAERFGYAIIFDKHYLSSEETLQTAVREGLESEELRAKAQMAKELLKSRPFSPQELLIRHVDLAVKFGNLPSLAPSGRHFSIIQYHNLDIIAAFIMTSLLITVTGVVLLRRCICSAKSVKVKKQ